MAKNRERIGRFIVTKEEDINEDFIKCVYCDKIILETKGMDDKAMDNNWQQLIESGNIAVPNFGWFCSQDCGHQYAKEFRVNFQLDENGKIISC